MSTRRWRPRAAALLAGGAFALHQLRYLLGYGGWAAGPLAVAIGFVVVLLLRGADRAIELAAEPALRIARPRPALSITAFLPSRPRPYRRVAHRLRARAPPLASIP